MEHRQWVSRYRDELKGIAILWVIFFHALLQCEGVLRDIQKIGYGGVDIFIFLTGYGLYRSLGQKEEIRGYWRRRMWRILPAYLPFILCWMAVMFPGYGLSTVQIIRSAAGNLLLCGYWFSVPRTFNWYISALMLLIALAPLFYGLLSRSARPAATLAMMLAAAFLVGLCCVGLDQYMAISRLPIFILGMAFAMDWRPRWKAGLKWLAYALSFGAGLFLVLLCHASYPELLLDYGMYWYPFALITPGLCVFFAWLFHKAERAVKVFAPLRWLGRASFEIYLMNIWLVELGKKYSFAGNLEWALLSLGCALLGVGHHALVEAGVKRIRPRLADGR